MRDFRMQLPRAYFSIFNGDNPIELIRKCRYYFEIHQVPDVYKTKYASLYFQGRADDWYGGYIMENEPPTWTELVELIKKRLKKKGSRSAIDEFKRVHQIGSIEEYVDQFEKAKSNMLLEDRYFPESVYLEEYISGLKEEIKPFVLAFNPSTLSEAFELSQHMECAS